MFAKDDIDLFYCFVKKLTVIIIGAAAVLHLPDVIRLMVAALL